VYERTKSNQRHDDQTHHLLHELANDLAAIHMRVDILIGTASTGANPLAQTVRTDLVVLRSTTEHAIATAEQVALLLTDADHRVIDEPDV
jgi:hypothetical protein